jgi:thioredoxin-dependent peroxiredoxin
VGVSRDDQQTSDSFRASLDLPFPLVGDTDGHISKAWRVKWPLIGIDQRVTYLVGRNGKVRLAFHSERDPEAHVAEACRAAAAP